ncbi:MAG: hypothetical protein V8R55_12640 [Dysosmobacter sp.]
MYHPDSVATLHQRILKDAGLEHLRFHDLRHTFATLPGSSERRGHQNGVRYAGHTTARFTLGTYTHVTGDMQHQGGPGGG